MQRILMRTTGTGLACLSLLLAGCGDMNIKKYLPFGNETAPERSRAPVNATEYQCAAGKHFHVRMLEGGGAVWLILPEREVRLEKVGAEGGMRYSNGISVLEINGSDASLKDGATISYVGCKAGSSQ
jgi:membrane-bound inhibitor of C-type lysozyme